MKNKTMNKRYIFLLLTIAVFIGTACKDDKTPVIKGSDSDTGLTSINLVQPVSGGAYILKESEAATVWETFVWNKANDENVATESSTFEVEIDNQGGDFSDCATIKVSQSPVEITEGQLNDAMNILGYTTPGSLANLKVRVKQIMNSSFVYYSAADSFTAIGYGQKVITYSYLYVPGDYQGWSPDNTYKLYSTNPNKDYTGYVYFANSTASFDLCPAPSWDNKYATSDATPGLSGTLSYNSGNDIKFSGAAGPYLLTANTTNLTWSLTPAPEFTANNGTWGVTGEMTNWGDNVVMTYNTTNGLLEVTTNLIAGTGGSQGFKFRPANSWDVAYGDGGTPGVADAKGGNIYVATTGNYLIQLDMRNPAQITYTLTPQ